MIDKLEAGKTYRLIDKDGYIDRCNPNMVMYKRYFIDNCITIDNVNIQGEGSILEYKDYALINIPEYKFFELVEGKTHLHLQQINSPFGELDKQTKKDLLCAWVDGAEIEYRNFIGTWVKVTCVGDIEFYQNTIYRVKPTISAKDAAKAKLISEAQQQLRDAQEALDKAQQL